jgi:son of sevenless-like protein
LNHKWDEFCLELAEAAEFDVYIKYAKDVTAPTCRETLNNLLSRPEVESALITAGQGMGLALKYYLPALLMGPIRHCFSYLEYITLLRGLSVAPDDRETLTQVEGLLKPVQIELGNPVRFFPKPLVNFVLKDVACPRRPS